MWFEGMLQVLQMHYKTQENLKLSYGNQNYSLSHNQDRYRFFYLYSAVILWCAMVMTNNPQKMPEENKTAKKKG